MAGGCEEGVEYEGVYVVDWTNSINDGLENPVIHSTFGYAAQLVELDSETGEIAKVVAAHDVGRAVNPLLCEGQIEGAVHMGLGYALTEGFPCDEHGKPLNETLRSLDIIRPKDMPPTEVILVESPDPNSPYGIKGVGEIGLVPTAGAVAAALHAHDDEWRHGCRCAPSATESGERLVLSDPRRRRAWSCEHEPPAKCDDPFMTVSTPGLVCAHHHLYSALARGMPAPPRTPGGFQEILELVWWRLDLALDLEAIEWSAKLGALEALERGTTAIIDHHESPNAIEGSLSVIADACQEVGVRISCATASPTVTAPRVLLPVWPRTIGSWATVNDEGYVGLHAAFTCSDDTIAAAAELARKHDVGVHVHVAEGDSDTWQRLVDHSDDDWLIVHGVHLPDDHGLRGTLVHNPRSNMNNSVGYARPGRFDLPIALGTDGIGADMLEEFRLAYVAARADDVTATPDQAWGWLQTGWDLMPAALNDRVYWAVESTDPWHLAFTPGTSPLEVEVDGEVVWDGEPTLVDGDEIRAKAAEAATKLHARLAALD